VFDYLARQKMSGPNLNYYILKQLACPPPSSFIERPAWASETLDAFVRCRVLELSYSSERLRPYAADISASDPGEPFRWVPERREQLRAEIDAAMFHVYGLARSDTEHVLGSFGVLQRNEERDCGEFRTERLVLNAYDAMTEAARTGVPFVSPLDPPPGHGPRHKERM
jgi:hypothetical protein